MAVEAAGKTQDQVAPWAPELLEPHPADSKTGLIKGRPEWVPEVGETVNPRVREQLLEGRGSWIGEPETVEPMTVPEDLRSGVQCAPRTADLSGVVFHERSTPPVETVQRPRVGEPGPLHVDEPSQLRDPNVPAEHPYEPELAEHYESETEVMQGPVEEVSDRVGRSRRYRVKAAWRGRRMRVYPWSCSATER